MHGATYASLGANERGFMGIFHVHPMKGPSRRGSEPSRMDIKTNTENCIPNLVISAFPESDISLYLVYSGKYETLYEGRLDC